MGATCGLMIRVTGSVWRIPAAWLVDSEEPQASAAQGQKASEAVGRTSGVVTNPPDRRKNVSRTTSGFEAPEPGRKSQRVRRRTQ